MLCYTSCQPFIENKTTTYEAWLVVADNLISDLSLSDLGKTSNRIISLAPWICFGSKFLVKPTMCMISDCEANRRFQITDNNFK